MTSCKRMMEIDLAYFTLSTGTGTELPPLTSFHSATASNGQARCSQRETVHPALQRNIVRTRSMALEVHPSRKSNAGSRTTVWQVDGTLVCRYLLSGCMKRLRLSLATFLPALTHRGRVCFVLPVQYLLAVAYLQANQLSHWPSALWHSWLQCVMVMEGWTCPGVRCSHRKCTGHSQWVVRLLCTSEGALSSTLPKASFSLSRSAKTTPFLAFILFPLPWILEKKVELWSGWAEWYHEAQASTQGIMGSNILSALKWEWMRDSLFL